MTDSTDPRRFLYRDQQLDPDGALRVTAQALKSCDDGELYLQYIASESFGFDDGRLKTADFNTEAGFGLRGVSGETTAFAHANELSEAAIRRAAETMTLLDPARATKSEPPRRTNTRLYTDADPLGLIPFARKVELCQTIDAAARARDPRVAQVTVGAFGIVERRRDRARRRLRRERHQAAGEAQRIDRRRAEWAARERLSRARRALSL
jgi:TldD protein